MGHHELDLEAYRRRAERFVEEIDREYLLHLSGRKPELELAPIYDRHAELFRRGTVERMRQTAARATGEERRRLRYLLHFALDGMIGEATRGESEEAARLEASLEVDVDGEVVPLSPGAGPPANEADAERRRALEAARNALLAERLNPLLVSALERTHSICAELGWRSYAAAYAELRDLDLRRWPSEPSAFLAATEDGYAAARRPRARARRPALGWARSTRSDLPRFFRVPELDAGFPAERLVPSFAETLAGLGIDLGGAVERPPRHRATADEVAAGVLLGAEGPRRGPPRDRAGRWPRGLLGALFTRAVTSSTTPAPSIRASRSSFAIWATTRSPSRSRSCCEQLTEDRGWLREILGSRGPRARDRPRPRRPAGDGAALLRQARLRARAALGRRRTWRRCPIATASRSATRSGSTGRARPGSPTSTRVSTSPATCGPGRWRRSGGAALRERFGERWFAAADAGEWLRGLWRQGQRLGAEELLAETLGEELSFEPLRLELSR